MNPNEEVKRILYCMPETAGDVFLSTGVVMALHKKYPNAKIYFATKKEYFNILEKNPLITKVIEYNEMMLNYRYLETWGPQKNPFDIVYCPFIVTQRIPHWIHNGYGEFLGVTYAQMCGVKFDELFIYLDNDLAKFNLPPEFITIHSQTRQDPKDYDYMQQIADRITGIPLVQIGGPKDKKLNGIVLDLRGKTTPQQLAAIFFKAKIHIGLDSFPMHVAAHVGCPCVILFGGTYAKQGVNPRRASLIHAIETDERGPCVTSCHLIECEAKKIGWWKCINNIAVDDVIQEVGGLIGEDKILPPKPIKLSAYMIIRDGIKYKFPFEECIGYARSVAKEVVVVDGGSTDGTFERLKQIELEMGSSPTLDGGGIIRVLQHPWDMDNPTLFGDEKTWARQQCTGDYLIQLDADEMIQEPYRGAIIDLIRKFPLDDVLDLPCVNFYGNNSTIRIEDNCWKWRISKNDRNIIHGVHGPARQLDQDTMKITMDKKVSDGCEYIYNDSLGICRHKPVFSPKLLGVHDAIKQGMANDKVYVDILKEVIQQSPVVYHYSWANLDRKMKNAEFWGGTFHGKKNETHNTVSDLAERMAHPEKEKLISVDFPHPLKEKKDV